ncbi:pentatricopeptide repeat-containing protein At2g33680-like [Castanea sativa]|uniref:pentatricopeptide repeat-containing protein At2g33680-like n=1 Tax=Castanea sativa TaxID=21020 RepID=UPI003F650322
MTEGIHKPDLVSYDTLIHGLIVAREVDVVLAMREKMLQKGVFPDDGIYNVLISGLCKKGRLPTAKWLFADVLDQKVQLGAFVYATLVDGCIRNSDIQEAKKLSELVIE